MLDNTHLVRPFVPAEDDGDTFVYTELLDRTKRKGKQILGFTHEVEWGTFTLTGPTQRIQHIASYEVNFDAADDSFQYKPDSVADLRRFSKGDRWRLTVGRIRRHNIEEMQKLQ